MKRFLLLFLLSVAASASELEFAWDYPSDELSTNLTFKLYYSTNSSVPSTNWVVVGTTVGTNLTMKVDVTPARQWFSLTASNMWGESTFSNVVETDGVPGKPLNFRLNAVQKKWFGEWFP